MAKGKTQSLGEQFCRRLVDALPTPQAKVAALSELQRWAGRHVYLPLPKQSERRVTAAANMLAQHMSTAAAALAIADRFRISLRQGQRDVAAARARICRQMSS